MSVPGISVGVAVEDMRVAVWVGAGVLLGVSVGVLVNGFDIFVGVGSLVAVGDNAPMSADISVGSSLREAAIVDEGRVLTGMGVTVGLRVAWVAGVAVLVKGSSITFGSSGLLDKVVSGLLLLVGLFAVSLSAVSLSGDSDSAVTDESVAIGFRDALATWLPLVVVVVAKSGIRVMAI